MIALLLNHLWQSSLCAGGAGLMALALSRNGAGVRFWLWFAASVKFLVPFALLTALGTYFLMPMVPPVAAPAITLIEPLAKPFAAPAIVEVAASAEPTPAPLSPSASPRHAASAATSAPHIDLESALLALWAAGFALLAARWLVRWWRVRALLRSAVKAHITAPVAVKFSASRLEPGLVGIISPVILLPQDIERQLTAVELRAVLAHELHHWRRHDNLLAAIHMLVEALFWFFPLVWWLGTRLNAERERACDEGVLADGNDPETYAEGILKVCRAYLQSPLACVAGVSGADLKKRVEAIMENRLILRLNAARKCALGAAAAAALVLPLALGLLAAPVAEMAAKASPIPLPAEYAGISAQPVTPEISTAVLQTNQPAASTGEVFPLHRAFRLPVENPVAPPPALSQLLLALPALVAANDPELASGMTAVSDQTSAPDTPQAVTARRDCAPPRLEDTVKMEPVGELGEVAVPIRLNGVERKFLFDTGGGLVNYVSGAVVREGRLTELRGGRSMDLKGNEFENGVIVDDVAFGGIKTSRVWFAVAPNLGFDGILSAGTLGRDDLDMDFGAMKLSFFSPDHCPGGVVTWPHQALAIVPVALVAGHIELPVTLDGHKLTAAIDTGAAWTVLNIARAEEKLGFSAEAAVAKSSDVPKDDPDNQIFFRKYSTLSFDGVTITNPLMMVRPLQFGSPLNDPAILGSRAQHAADAANMHAPDIMIGMEVLRHLHIYYAAAERMLYITPAASGGTALSEDATASPAAR